MGAAVARTHLKAFLVANLDLNDQAHGLREQLGAPSAQADLEEITGRKTPPDHTTTPVANSSSVRCLD